MGVKKKACRRGGKISFSERGGGINMVFGPKYRPLALWAPVSTALKLNS